MKNILNNNIYKAIIYHLINLDILHIKYNSLLRKGIICLMAILIYLKISKNFMIKQENISKKELINYKMYNHI